MLLIVSQSYDPTASFVEKRLDELQKSFVRLETEKMLTHFSHTTAICSEKLDCDEIIIETDKGLIDLNKVSAVWYRRPVEPKAHEAVKSPQARHYAEEEGYYYIKNLWRMLRHTSWISNPDAISWANVKLDQLKVARHIGMKIPDTLATTDPVVAQRFYDTHPCGVIVKPFTVNTLEYKDTLASIMTSRVTNEMMLNIEQVKYGITFFQQEIAKEFEVRVTVIGDDVYAAKVDSQSDERRKVDWRNTSNNPIVWYKHIIPDDLANQCRQVVDHYGLRFGTFDFAFTPEGEYVFFEMNPNGQWAWLEIELGYPMTDSLIKTFGI